MQLPFLVFLALTACTLSQVAVQVAAQSFIKHGNAANGPLTSSVGNAAARFLATMTSHVDGVEQLNSWEYSEASRRSLATVKDECAGQTFERCRDIVTDHLSQACGSSYDVSNGGSYERHTLGSGWGFLSGMTGLTGSINHVEELILGNDFSTQAVEDWWQSFLISMWFWWMFLAVAVLIAIGFCVWCPALCRKNYRSRLSCCRKERSYQSKLRRGILVFSFVWSMVFAILAIIFGVYVSSGVRHIECTSWRVTYGMLFGDTAYAAEHTWSGLMGVDGSFVEYGGGLELVDAGLAAHAETLLDPNQLPSMVVEFETELNGLQANLANTRQRLASGLAEFFPYSITPQTVGYIFETSSRQQCAICDGFIAHPVDEAAMAVELQRLLVDAGDLIVAYQDLPPLIERVGEVASVSGLDKVSNAMLEMSAISASISPYLASSGIAMYVIFCSVPLIAVVLGIVVLSVIVQKSRSKSGRKLLFNCPGCLCFCFAFLIAFLIIGGIVLTAITQPAAEGCYWVENDLFRENSYSDYDALTRVFNSSENFAPITTSCFTYDGDRELLDALLVTVPGIEEMPTVDESIDAIASEIETDYNTTVGEQLSPYDNPVEAYGYLIHISMDPNYLDRNHDDYEPRMYTLYKEFLYGGLQSEDVPVDSYTQPIASALRDVAVDAIENHNEYKFAAGSTSQIPKDELLAEANVTATHFYGMQSQEQRLNSAIIDFGSCSHHSVCFSTGTSPSCCNGREFCVEIDGNTTLTIIPSAYTAGGNVYERNLFYFFSTVNHETNVGEISDLLGCISGAVSANDDRAPNAILFLNSFFFAGFRVRTARPVFPFAMYNANPTIIEEASYEEFVTRTSNNWDTIYNAKLGEVRGIINGLYQLADDAERYYNVIRRELQCSLFFDSMAGGENYLCAEITADLGLLGVWWVMIALGLLFPMIVMYWMIDDPSEPAETTSFYIYKLDELCGGRRDTRQFFIPPSDHLSGREVQSQMVPSPINQTPSP